MTKNRLHASAYFRAGKIFLQASNYTSTGLIQADEPIAVLEGESPDETVGEALQETLRLTRYGPSPPDWEHPDPVLKAAGVKAWTTFSKGLSHVSVSCEDRVITLAPMRNLGGPGRFLRKKGDPEFTLPADVPPQELGKILREAFSVASSLGIRRAKQETK